MARQNARSKSIISKKQWEKGVRVVIREGKGARESGHSRIIRRSENSSEYRHRAISDSRNSGSPKIRHISSRFIEISEIDLFDIWDRSGEG